MTQETKPRRFRALHPDIRALLAADRALRAIPPEGRRPALEYLFDKYLNRHPSWLAAHDRERFGKGKP